MRLSYQVLRDGVVVGEAQLARPDGGAAWEVSDLDVRKDWRGQGIGTEIMTAICADADEGGVQVWLYCCPDQGRRADLIRFYERFAFVARNPKARCPNMRRTPQAVKVAA